MIAEEAKAGNLYRTPGGTLVSYRGPGEDLGHRVPNRHVLELLEDGRTVFCGPKQVLFPAMTPEQESTEFGLEW